MPRTCKTREIHKIWSGVGYNESLQQGNRNFDDSEESDLSQESEVSQTSQETDSSQEVTEHLNSWSRIQNEVEKRHEAQLNALINEYEENGDSNNVRLALKPRTLSFLFTEKN